MAGSALVVLGCLAALVSALAWAVGAVLFRRIGDFAEPLGMNLVKTSLGLLILAPFVALADPGVFTVRGVVLLALSGLLGIALGDTLFFMALLRLGARRTVLLGTVGQVFTVLLAVAVLGERPGPLAWAGMVAVLAGVTWVLREGTAADEAPVGGGGVALGVAATLCTSVGFVVAKEGVAHASVAVATFVRVAAGVAGLVAWGLATRRLGAWARPFRDRRLLGRISVAVLVVMLGGFYLSLLALKLAPASLVTVLTSTEPLFVLPIAALALGERSTGRAVAGAAVAVAGVAAILAGSG